MELISFILGLVLLVLGIAFGDITIKMIKGQYDHWWENDDE